MIKPRNFMKIATFCVYIFSSLLFMSYFLTDDNIALLGGSVFLVLGGILSARTYLHSSD